jgi:hypothetical protein
MKMASLLVLVRAFLLSLLSVQVFSYGFTKLPQFGSSLLSKTALAASTADFKNGMTFEIGNNHIQVQ